MNPPVVKSNFEVSREDALFSRAHFMFSVIITIKTLVNKELDRFLSH